MSNLLPTPPPPRLLSFHMTDREEGDHHRDQPREPADQCVADGVRVRVDACESCAEEERADEYHEPALPGAGGPSPAVAFCAEPEFGHRMKKEIQRSMSH